MSSARLLATLSRRRCGDLGQISGPREEVIRQINARAIRSRKAFFVHLLPLDAEGLVCGEPERMIRGPG